MKLRAEIASPKSIKLYRGNVLAGHLYTHDATFGWRSNANHVGARASKKQWPTAEEAAYRRWGAEGRAAVRAALAAREQAGVAP